MSTGTLGGNELRQAEKMAEAEKSKRALYFGTQLARHCLQLAQQLIDDFRPIKPETNGGRSTLNEDEYRSLIKEMLSLSVLMTLVQQSREGERTAWLDNFFERAFLAIDSLYPKPSAEEVIGGYAPEPQIQDTCIAAAMSLGFKLKLPADNDVTMGIGQRLFEARHDRATILRDSLKAPLGDLERLVREPLPMVIV